MPGTQLYTCSSLPIMISYLDFSD